MTRPENDIAVVAITPVQLMGIATGWPIINLRE